MKFSSWSYSKKVTALIFFIGILRLIFAFTIQLGNDESYYWLYSQHIKSNYFDHPPMVALWIRATTLNQWLQNYPGFIRLGSIISGCVATWFMFKCVSTLSNERAGWFAACLYNAFFYTSVTAGIFSFPDAPQMLFWTMCMYLLALITQKENSWKHWLLFGIAGGLCIMSKVHGLFIWIGLGCYIIFYKRKWLLNVKIYVALLISVCICLPILFWNIKYNFMTYKFNAPRINIENTAFNWQYLLDEIFAQLFKNNPLNVVFIFLGLIALLKHKLRRLPALTIFIFAGISHIIVLLVIASFKPTLAHWSGPAYVSLLPVGAIYLDNVKRKKRSLIWVCLSFTMHVFVLISCALVISFYPGTYGIKSGKLIGKDDNSIDLYGWQQAGKQFDSLYISYQQKKLIPVNTPVVCYKWWGAHIEYYFCKPANLKMIGLGNVMDLHEYAWMNSLRKDSVNMQQAFCIMPSDEFYNVHKAYGSYYNHIDSLTSIHIFRSGKPSQIFYVYHLSGWKGKIPVE